MSYPCPCKTGPLRLILSFLQALHALALSNLQLCVSGPNPSSFVLRLAPYLKIAAVNKGMAEEQQRQAVRQEAERLICLLPLMSTLMASVEGSLASIASEMERDLLQIIGRNPFTVVRPSSQQQVNCTA